jgi:hypothetical protein
MIRPDVTSLAEACVRHTHSVAGARHVQCCTKNLQSGLFISKTDNLAWV